MKKLIHSKLGPDVWAFNLSGWAEPPYKSTLISAISLFQSLPKACNQSWGLERGLSSGSAPSHLDALRSAGSKQLLLCQNSCKHATSDGALEPWQVMARNQTYHSCWEGTLNIFVSFCNSSLHHVAHSIVFHKLLVTAVVSIMSTLDSRDVDYTLEYRQVIYGFWWSQITLRKALSRSQHWIRFSSALSSPGDVFFFFIWKLAWSGGSYHTRISVALFTLLRSHSPHSARRQMSSENLANMPEMRFVIASRLWPHRHTNSRSREVCGVCLCLCVCVTICFSVLPPVLSAHIRPDKFGIFSKCFYDVNPASSAMCESFCWAAALYQTSRPAASLRTLHLNWFILSSIANIVICAERESCKILSVSSHSSALQKPHNEG